MTDYRMWIGGEWVDAASGARFETFNPYTGKAWATIPRGAAEDADRAVTAAHRAFRSKEWRGLSAAGRGELLRRFADLVAAKAQYLAEIEQARVERQQADKECRDELVRYLRRHEDRDLPVYPLGVSALIELCQVFFIGHGIPLVLDFGGCRCLLDHSSPWYERVRAQALLSSCRQWRWLPRSTACCHRRARSTA